jgi:ABC-type polysaccharide/polyol phosphate transport system ATPase subunit
VEADGAAAGHAIRTAPLYPVAVPSPPAVVIDGLSKTFRIPREQVHTLKERALHPFRRAGHDELRALADVSFAVEHGEFFGIVGRNGSGKSTLLKCLAGIYRADRGRIFVNGRLSTFIELGVGFNPDLAARDNVLLNATMLGLSPREAARRYDAILDFAELHEFEDLKLKNYSSGMMVRLAFSVMIQVDADILLVDEVLAVGDAAFQQKCFDEFGRIRRTGATVLLVTHDMNAVRRFCDRAMLIHKGNMDAVGDPQAVGNRYLALNFGGEAAESTVHSAEAEEVTSEADDVYRGDQKAHLMNAWFEDEHGQHVDNVPTGPRCTFAARVSFKEALTDPVFGVALSNEADRVIWAASTERERTGEFAEGSVAVFRITFDNLLAPGRYYASPWIGRHQGGEHVHDRHRNWTSIIVHGQMASTGGVVDLAHTTSVERAARAEEAVG